MSRARLQLCSITGQLLVVHKLYGRIQLGQAEQAWQPPHLLRWPDAQGHKGYKGQASSSWAWHVAMSTVFAAMPLPCHDPCMAVQLAMQPHAAQVTAEH